MGLLDDLKKQADMLKTQQLDAKVLRSAVLKSVEEKMKQSFQYLNELLKQLQVLKPENPLAFTIPSVGEMKGLKFAESFIDYRKKHIDDAEYLDTINFYIRWQAPQNFTVERDMPGTIQKTRDALWHYKVKFAEEEIKNARGAVERTRFNIVGAIVTDVVIRAAHAEGKLMISASNLMRLEKDSFAVPLTAVNEAFLEDFARTLLGGDSVGLRKYRATAL